MRHGKLLANGLVIVAAGWMLVHGTKTQEAGLLPGRARAVVTQGATSGTSATSETRARGPISTDAALAALEERAALSPDAESVGKLAAAYLDRDQSGLASAVLQKASPAIQASPEIAHLQARALLHRGRVPEALAVAKQVEATCEAGMNGGEEGVTCPAWLIARSARQLAFLEEMSSAGIEDPVENPEGARAAFDRSARAVRFVAMR